MSITIDYSRDYLLTEYAAGMLKDFYLRGKEKSPQDAFARASKAWATYHENHDPELANRLYDYVSKGWFMYASPVLSNAPNGDAGETKGLPISCFLTYVPDTLEGLIEKANDGLNRLVQWYSSNKLAIHPAKSKGMIFQSSNKFNIPIFNNSPYLPIFFKFE